jgi:hypothetical protein
MKGINMRKFIILCVFLLTALCSADIATSDIKFSNLATTNDVVKLLRSKFAQHNVDIDSLGGLSNRGTGKVFYVDSEVGNDSYVGTSPAKATATIDAAVNLCTANRGDVIFVMQGHAETLDNGTSDALDLDVAGITVVGLGNGSDMPEITFDTTTDEIAIDADSVVVIGLRLLAGVSEVVLAFDVKDGADDCAIIGCVFPEPTTSSWEFDKGIVITTADRLLVQGCLQYTADAVGATNFIDNDGGVTNGCRYLYNVCIGEYAEGIIHSDDADLENFVAYNDLSNLTTGQHAIEFTAAATGSLIGNTVFTDAEATSIDPGSLKCFNNLVSIAIDTSGVVYPALGDLATNLIGVDDGNNAASTTNVAANADGSVLERLEQVDVDTSAIITDTAAMQPIQEYSIKASITTIASGEDVLFTVAGGPIKVVEIIGIVTGVIQAQSTLINYNVAVTTPAGDVVFGTDGTALEINADAAGTLYTWNGVIANDLVATTSGVALGLASGTTTGLIVPPGDIELSSTAASTGTIDFYMRYIPLDSSSVVTAP